MKTSSLLQQAPKSPADIRNEWVRSVEALANQVLEWVRLKPGWQADSENKDISEEPLGTYSIPIVTIHTPNGRLVLEPIARNFPGRGIVEFYAWPTLFRVRLLRGEEDADWQVRVDSGFILHEEWNRDNFVRLAGDLLNAS
jgi:hypothetical protein